MVFIHTRYTKQNPILELISAPPHSIPFLLDRQKELWDLIENIRSKGIENPIWGVKSAVKTTHQTMDNQGRITEFPNGGLGDFIITGEIYAKIVKGLKEIEAAMIKEFANDSKKINWLRQLLPLNDDPCTQCGPATFNCSRDFCNKCHEKIHYYYGNITGDISALHREYQELKKQKEETEQKKKQDEADTSYIKMIWEKYKILFGKNFEKEKITQSEKIGKHKEYHDAVMRNSMQIPQTNPYNKALIPTYRIGQRAISVTDYARWEEETDNYVLNSQIKDTLLKELTMKFGSVVKNEYVGGGQFKIINVIRPKGKEVYDYIISTANKYYAAALEEAKLDQLATIEARKRLDAKQMEKRVMQKMQNMVLD